MKGFRFSYSSNVALIEHLDPNCIPTAHPVVYMSEMSVTAAAAVAGAGSADRLQSPPFLFLAAA
jgi:hypothetical protein